MSLKWLRKYRLTIGKENAVGASNAAKSVIITDSHIEFDVSVTGDSKLNTLDLKIYNLSRSTIAIFDIENVQVTLEVAYGDDPFVVLFKGEKTYMTTAKKGTEVITTVKAAEGSVATKEGQVNTTLPQNSKVRDVLNKLISEGMPDVKSINMNGETLDRVYNKGFSASGNVKKALDDLCKSNNLQWTLDKGDTINIYPLNGDTKVKAIQLTPYNGLINTPEKTNKEIDKLKKDLDKADTAGVKFECLLEPLIQAGGVVQLKGTFNADGNYKVTKVSHSGGYESDNWTTSVEAVNY